MKFKINKYHKKKSFKNDFLKDFCLGLVVMVGILLTMIIASLPIVLISYLNAPWFGLLYLVIIPFYFALFSYLEDVLLWDSI